VCYSPVKDTVVTNDRWGRGISCNHGGYLTCSDRYSPGQFLDLWHSCCMNTGDVYCLNYKYDLTV